MEQEKYKNDAKPLLDMFGEHYDGNLYNHSDMDSVRMFVNGTQASFNGFAGTNEFQAFPLRQLFLNRYKQLPSEWDTGFIKSDDIHKYIAKNKKKVIATHYSKNQDINKCLLYLGGKEFVYAYIYDRGYWYKVKDRFGIALLFTERTKAVKKLMDFFTKLVIPDETKEEKGYLNILTVEDSRFKLQKKEVPIPEIDFDINYNEDFTKINKLIIEKLSVDNSKGIVLLHGKAGTGKTTYIRYLINSINKKIIYIPPSMANSLANPELIKFLMNNSNSILVIEDAENVLMKRSENSSEAIANILNLTDGLLSDCANIQVVATFNTDLLNIDEALLRKGRLIARYEFKELEEDRVLKLCEKLGVKNNGKQVLTNIYNANEASFTKEKSKIGF